MEFYSKDGWLIGEAMCKLLFGFILFNIFGSKSNLFLSTFGDHKLRGGEALSKIWQLVMKHVKSNFNVNLTDTE